MKLLHAHFQNFRLLRDVDLDFSVDPLKKLTVVRAANESGKTTILHALQWALYGDSALPGKGERFRLHPIDWDAGEGSRVPIMVTIEFEVSSHRQVAGELRETRQRYRLVRSVFEDVDDFVHRPPSTVKLFALRDIGATPIDSPEALIHDQLPPELREVFFTDGDRALSFIEADVAQSTKRERVQHAIQSLLGLGVVDDAIRHVRKAAAELNKKAKALGSDGDLVASASRLEAIEQQQEAFDSELRDSKEQFAAFDERIEEIERQIAAALQKGDRETLAADLEQARRDIRQLDEQLAAAAKEHSALFRGEALAKALLAPVIRDAFAKLHELHDRGKIPSATIPVLQDRLEAEVCICGETLDSRDAKAVQRRAHIEKLIGESQRADAIQESITELYYGARPMQAGRDDWLNEYATVVERRDGLSDLREEAGRKFRSLELQLDSLPDTDVQGLRATRRQYSNQRDRQLARQSALETQLDALRQEGEALTKERDRLLREQAKGSRILAEVEVTKDVIQVLQGAYDQITNDELKAVSQLMDKVFREMIGADPEQNAIIQRAAISPEFDIIVFGPDNRTLDPDRDLNGASRRALTLAFILALTKVSEVEAPNVIDTPLGMTSGFVKRSILRVAVRESAQLILFLTHAEIAGCEDILDEAAGVVVTLTNPAHYPVMLMNDPGTTERNVLRCFCNHRSECAVCARRADIRTAEDARARR